MIGRPDAAAEVNRTIRAELDIEAKGPFAVENLAGSMRVAPGSGSKVVAVATVFAENQKLADSLRRLHVSVAGELPPGTSER